MDTDLVPVKTGRPTLYREEYCTQIIEFFSAPRKSKRVAVSQEVGGKDGWKKAYRVICGDLPSLKTFALSIGVTAKTICEWQNAHPAFREACTRAQHIAEALLIERTNNGLYNAQFASFYAKNVFGWKDKTEVETTTGADTVGMEHMRKVLSSASPDQLQRFASLMEEMESALPKQIESTQ